MASILSLLKLSTSGNQSIVRGSTLNQRSTLTQDAFVESCRALAEELSRLPIKVLALHADNSTHWLVIDIACQQAGICLVPLPTFFSDEQLRHVFDSAPIDGLLCENSELFEGILDRSCESLSTRHRRLETQHICLDGLTLLQLIPSVSSKVLPPHTDKITFTSGSTGQPKGVCLSNAQLIKQASALAETLDLSKPRHLCLLPLSTLLENVAGNYTPLLAGGEVIIPSLGEIGFEGSSSINPDKFIAVIDRAKPNSIILTPQLAVLLVSAANQGWKPPSSLQFVAVGGGKVSSKLLREAQDLGIPAFEGYGLSECASVVSLNTARHHQNGSCGKPLAHLDIEIVDHEIVVSGNAMLGYLGEPDSWGQPSIATGDLGYLDHSGYLHVSGRKKNLLISSFGRNINPEWLESEVLAQTAIAECVVFGDAKPYCVALILPRKPDDSDEVIQSIIDTINSRLPDYARIVRWSRLPQALSTQKILTTDNGRPKRDAIFTHYHDVIMQLYADQKEDAVHDVF